MAKIKRRRIDPPRLTDEQILALRQLEAQADEEIAEYTAANGIAWVPSAHTLDLHFLPAERQRFFTKQMDQIRGVQDVMTEYGAPPWVRPPDIEGIRVRPSDRPYAGYRINPEDIHENSVFYARNYFQYRPEEGPALWDQFSIRSKRYRIGYEQEIAEQLRRMRAGEKPFTGRLMVLDTETAGLDPSLGMRSVGYRVFDEDMNETSKQVMHLKNNFFKWGTVGSQSLEDFAKSNLGVGEAGYTEFGDAMKEFLRAAKEVDFQIAAYNAPFDLRMLLHGMRNFGEYKTNPEFKSLVDEFATEMNRSGKMIDMADMVRVGLGLDLAPELAERGIYQPASHANVLLQTNFLDLLHQHEDPEMVRAAISGLHQEDYDVWLESRLYKYFSELKKGPISRRKYGDLAQSIVNSTAWAPGIRLPAANVDPALRSFLTEQGLLDEGGAKITAYEHMILQARHKAPELARELPRVSSPADVVHGAQLWNDFTKDIINRTGLIKRTGPGLRSDVIEATTELQRGIGEAGLPYHELSLPERLISAIASGWKGIEEEGASNEQRIRSLFGAAIPSPRFYGAERAAVAGRDIPILPLDVLDQIIGPEATRVLAMSPFQTQAGVKEVAFKLQPTEEHVQKILEFLRNPGEYQSDGGAGLVLNGFEHHGITQEEAAALHEAISTSGQLKGIQVGTYGQLAGETSTARLHDVLAEQMGGTVEASYSPFGVIRAGAAATTEHRGQQVSTGPAVLMKGLNEPFVRRMEEQAPGVGLTLSVLGREATESELGNAESVLGETFARRASILTNTDAFYDTFLKRGIKGIAIAGTAALLGRIAYNKHRERKMANEPILQQPTQIGNISNQVQGAIPQPTDYLATAGVTRVLDENRQGHHRMGPYKDRHLFSF